MQQRFVLSNSSEELPVFRNEMRKLLPTLGWPEKQKNEWLLVLDEALTNIMRHAYCGKYGEIIVEITDSKKQTEFCIEDHGKSFNPTTLPKPKLPKDTPGGLGVHLIRSLTDRFEYDTSFRGGNRIRLVRLKNASVKT